MTKIIVVIVFVKILILLVYFQNIQQDFGKNYFMNYTRLIIFMSHSLILFDSSIYYPYII